MPRFRIQQYETWVQAFDVTANDAADAIIRHRRGKSEAVDDSLELSETNHALGISDEQDPDLYRAVAARAPALVSDCRIPSIRSVEEIDDGE